MKPRAATPPLPPSPAPPGAGALLVNAFLFDQRTFISRVEWDSPWGIIGCQIWHLLLLQKNRPNAMHRVSEQLPSTETPTVSKTVEGRAGIPGRAGLERGLRRVVEGPRPEGHRSALPACGRAGVQGRGEAPAGRCRNSCAGRRRRAGAVPAEPCGT